MNIIGYCEECGMAVYQNTDYYHDEPSNKYWHKPCLPSDENIGYE